MIVRIVRMHFSPSTVEDFLRIFYTNYDAIRHFEGCTHLELLHDLKDHAVCTTLSHWKDERSLERYRQSELFAGVWSRVKPLFTKRPEALSLISPGYAVPPGAKP